MNETSPYLRVTDQPLFFIGTFFGELFVYKMENSQINLIKSWKFRSAITSVVTCSFKNDRLIQISKLFEQQGINERTIITHKAPERKITADKSFDYSRTNSKKDSSPMLQFSPALTHDDKANDTLLSIGLAKGRICLMSFNLAN